MQKEIIPNGGIQYISQFAATQQIIYLDFDGELTDYNGEFLTVNNIEVINPQLSQERIDKIISELNEKYAYLNIKFVTVIPENTEYSTVYIGKTSSFDKYGTFAGIAETIDSGNKNKTDKAFVMLDAAYDDTTIITTISHEADHLLGILSHDGDGLAKYACTFYNETISGNFNGQGQLFYIDTWLNDDQICSSRCDSPNVFYNRIAYDTVLTSGKFRITTGHSIVSAYIGNGATVTLAGNTIISSGTEHERYESAYADAVTVTSGGVLHVGIEGRATNITIQSSGTIAHGWTDKALIHHGSNAAFISDFNQDGQVFGRIDNFNFNGHLYAQGAKLNNVTVGKEPTPNGGYFYGYLYLNDGSIATNTTVQGVMYVNSGNSAVNTVIVENGNLYASSGAIINNLTLSGGSAEIYSGTNISGTLNVNGGTLKFIGGEYSVPLIIRNSGLVEGTSSAIIKGAKIYSGGTLGGSTSYIASNTVVYSGGYQFVYSNKFVYNTTLSSGGSMLVYGSAFNTVIDGGVQNISGGYDSGYAENTIIKNGSQVLLQHGRCSAVSTYISSGAVQIVNSYTEAHNTIISEGGLQEIIGGGNALALAINTVVYGTQTLTSKYAFASNTEVYGKQFIDNNASACDTIVKSGGKVNLGSDVYVSNLQIDAGGYVSGNSAALLYGNVNIEGTLTAVCSAKTCTVQKGGLLSNSVITGRYNSCTTIISQGGSAIDVTIAGGAVISAVIDKETYLDVNLNGSKLLAANGIVTQGNITSKSYLQINSDAKAENITVGTSGSMTVYGSANGTLINSNGTLEVISGGKITDTKNYYLLRISDKGTAENTSVFKSATVYSGGTALHTSVNRYGSMTVSSGGHAKYTSTYSGGYVYVYSGGTAAETVVNKNGQLTVSSGGTATVAFNPWSGTVSSGTGAVVTYLNRDAGVYLGHTSGVFISKADIMQNIVVSSGIAALVYSDGIMQNSIIESGGILDIAGTHRGSLTIHSGAIISAYTGTIFDFTVSGRTASDGYLINNLSLIQGTPTYTITVSDDLKTGTYKLAQGASNFKGSVSIGDSNIKYGNITVNGDDFVYNGKTYSLDQSSGNLTLTVSSGDIIPPVKPTVSANITSITNQDVVITATFSNDSVIKEYSFDNKTWNQYTSAITMSQNGSLYFRGKDAAGNISDVTTYTVSNIDKAAPVLNGTPTAAVNGQKVTFSWNAANDNTAVKGYYLTVGNNKYTVTGTSYTLTLEEGTYTYSLTAFDTAGNESNKSVNKTFTVATTPTPADNIKPTITSVNLSQGSNNYTFTAAITASDNKTAVGNLKYQIKYASTQAGLNNAAPFSGKTFTLTENAAGKTYYYQVGVTDEAGNTTWSTAKSFAVNDVSAPVLNGTPTAVVNGNSVTFSWSAANDNIGIAGYYLTVNGIEYKVSGTSFTLDKLNMGTYTYSLYAFDSAGNESSKSVNKTFTVEPTTNYDITTDKIPAEWNDSLIIATNKDATDDNSTFTIDDNIYISFAIYNNADAVKNNFITALYVDNVLIKEWNYTEEFISGNFLYLDNYDIGTLSVGNHTVKIIADSQDNINEINENNNIYTKTIYVSGKDNGMAIYSSKLTRSTTVDKNSLFSAKADITTSNDDFFALFSYGEAQHLILNNNISISNTRVFDDSYEDTYTLTAAVYFAWDNQYNDQIDFNFVTGNNKAKKIKSTYTASTFKDLEATGFVALEGLYISGQKFLYSFDVKSENTGSGNASAYGMSLYSIFANADITKNINVSAVANGRYATATASALDAGGDIYLQRGISGNISVTAQSKYSNSTAAAFAAADFDSEGKITGKITVNATGNTNNEQVLAYGIKADFIFMTNFDGKLKVSAKNTGTTYAYGIKSEAENENELSILSGSKGQINVTASSTDGDANAYGICSFDTITIANYSNAITISATSKNNEAWGAAIHANNAINIFCDIDKNISVSTKNTRATAAYDTKAWGLYSTKSYINMQDIKANMAINSQNEGNASAIAFQAETGIKTEDITGNITAVAINKEHYGDGNASAYAFDCGTGTFTAEVISGKFTITATDSNATAIGIEAVGDVTIDDMAKSSFAINAKSKNGDASAAAIITSGKFILDSDGLNLGKVSVNAQSGRGYDATAIGLQASGAITTALNIGQTLSGDVVVNSNGTSVGIWADSIDVKTSVNLQVSGTEGAYGYVLGTADKSILNISNAKITTGVSDKFNKDNTYAVYALTGDANQTVFISDTSVVHGNIDLAGGVDTVCIEAGSKLKGALSNTENIILNVADVSAKNKSLWDITDSYMTQANLEIDFDYGMTGDFLVCTKESSVRWSDAFANGIDVSFNEGLNILNDVFKISNRDNYYSDGFYEFELNLDGNKMILSVTEKIR